MSGSLERPVRGRDLAEVSRMVAEAAALPAGRHPVLSALAEVCLVSLRVMQSDLGPVTMSRYRLRRVHTMVASRLSDAITLEDMARAAGMGRSGLCRCFRRATGMSPLAYVRAYRVAQGAKLMATTPVPLSEIALAVGFSSQSHFTTAFRRLVGLPPGRWRESVRIAGWIGTADAAVRVPTADIGAESVTRRRSATSPGQ